MNMDYESRIGRGGREVRVECEAKHCPSALRYDATKASIRLRAEATARQELQLSREIPSFKLQSRYGLTRSRSLGPRGSLASPDGAPALAKCFPRLGLSLSRHANLSPLPKRLKTHDLHCEVFRAFEVFGGKSEGCAGLERSINVNAGAEGGSRISTMHQIYESYDNPRNLIEKFLPFLNICVRKPLR
jgi:hypothetical protein